MAHGRLTALRKVKSSELQQLEKKLNPGNLFLYFGKYQDSDIQLPELIMKDPGYFYWAYYSGAFGHANPWLDYQAWTIIQKAAHIRPPRPRPDSWEFAIQFDRTGRFLDFQIIKKSEKLKPRARLLRVKHLDLSLVSLADEKACAKMAERIREEFFPDRKLTHWDYQEFFDNERKFDLSCREQHCPKIPRRVVVKRACRDEEADKE